MTNQHAAAADPGDDRDDAYEGPDVETSPDGGSAGHAKPGGLGQDGTIPDAPNGVAAGHTGEPSTFEPEEDESAGTASGARD